HLIRREADMRRLDLTLASAAENLALDEALLLQAEGGDGGEVLRLWEWRQSAVVLGSGCQIAEGVEVEACPADGVPIPRGSSGGGTVLLGKGCLCFSLVLAFARDPMLTEVRSSYRYILGKLIEAFALPGLELAGISDLAIGGYKFSGNAQQRKRHHLLHHGTLLYDFDLGLVARYLRMPARQPEYRDGRGHSEFLMNLPAGVETLKNRLRKIWDASPED